MSLISYRSRVGGGLERVDRLMFSTTVCNTPRDAFQLSFTELKLSGSLGVWHLNLQQQETNKGQGAPHYGLKSERHLC